MFLSQSSWTFSKGVGMHEYVRKSIFDGLQAFVSSLTLNTKTRLNAKFRHEIGAIHIQEKNIHISQSFPCDSKESFASTSLLVVFPLTWSFDKFVSTCEPFFSMLLTNANWSMLHFPVVQGVPHYCMNSSPVLNLEEKIIRYDTLLQERHA